MGPTLPHCQLITRTLRSADDLPPVRAYPVSRQVARMWSPRAGWTRAARQEGSWNLPPTSSLTGRWRRSLGSICRRPSGRRGGGPCWRWGGAGGAGENGRMGGGQNGRMAEWVDGRMSRVADLFRLKWGLLFSPEGRNGRCSSAPPQFCRIRRLRQ